ncbi:MAG: LacI family DNA-binding transcriptional regulator [Candidatus Limnocylindria bacterium]
MTLVDVAQEAGVSPSTVSRHLRGQHVREAEIIDRAVAALGYSPNLAAQSLKSGSTLAVGVVVPDVSNPFFAAVVKGIEAAAHDDRYSIFLCNTDESSERERAVLAQLSGRIDGLILTPATEHAEKPLELERFTAPTVFVDRTLEGATTFDSVLIDNEGGARQAAEHLLALGHRRIAAINGPLDTTPGRGRATGFADAIADAGIELPPEYVVAGDFREESARQATLRLLALARPPTAIFTANNLMTIGALRALHEMRARVPEEISLVGFDELELGELLAPPLTVVARPTIEQGVLAMRLLRSRIESRDSQPAQRIVLETTLVVRGSSGPPREDRR